VRGRGWGGSIQRSGEFVSVSRADKLPDEQWYPPVIYFKLYPVRICGLLRRATQWRLTPHGRLRAQDVCVYFATLMAMGIVGMAAAAVPGVRRLLHTRVRVPWPRKWVYYALWPTGVTVGEWLVRHGPVNPTTPFTPLSRGVAGELLALACFLWLNVYWIWYWGFDYQRIRYETANMGDTNPGMQVRHGAPPRPSHTPPTPLPSHHSLSPLSTQICARVLGHLTTLAMSFVAFPITRNSVWEALWGIPFERAVKYHRALGRLVWFWVTAHMLMWQLKWAKEGACCLGWWSVVPSWCASRPAFGSSRSAGNLWNNVVTIDHLYVAWPA